MISSIRTTGYDPDWIQRQMGQTYLPYRIPVSRWYMIVKYFIDIAGKEGEDRAIAAAGYIASEPQLEQFRFAWRHLLQLAGSTDGVFHANEFFARRGRFRHLDGRHNSERHADLARSFALAAHSFLPNGFTYAIDCDHFGPELGRVFARAKTPHDRMPAVLLAVAAICDEAAKKCLPPTGRNQAIAFVEAGGETGEVIDFLRWLKAVGEPWTRAFVEFAPIPKTDFAVQAADYLAYEAWLEATRVLEDPSVNNNWDGIPRETFKVLSTGGEMLPPSAGTCKIDAHYSSREHFRQSAPIFAKFIATHPQYQRIPWWRRWRRNSRLWWGSKKRRARKAIVSRAKRLWYGTLRMGRN